MLKGSFLPSMFLHVKQRQHGLLQLEYNSSENRNAMNSEIWYYLYVCSRIHLCMWCLYIYLQVSMPMHAHMESGEHLPLLRSTFAFEAGSPTETGAHSLLRLAGQ